MRTTDQDPTASMTIDVSELADGTIRVSVEFKPGMMAFLRGEAVRQQLPLAGSLTGQFMTETLLGAINKGVSQVLADERSHHAPGGLAHVDQPVEEDLFRTDVI